MSHAQNWLSENALGKNKKTTFRRSLTLCNCGVEGNEKADLQQQKAQIIIKLKLQIS